MGIDIYLHKFDDKEYALAFSIDGKDNGTVYLKSNTDSGKHHLASKSLDKEECVALMALLGHDIFIHDKP